MQTALCFLTTFFSMLPIFSFFRPQHTELVSNEELVRIFYSHKSDFKLIVCNVNYLAHVYPKQSPTELLRDNCEEALTASQQLGVRGITHKGFFGRVGLEMDRTPTAIKEIVWHPCKFQKKLLSTYDKKYDVFAISDSWAIVTTPLK